MKRSPARKAGEGGFSLIELLVVVFLFALIVLLVDLVFVTVNRSSRAAQLASDVQQNARVAIERMTREIRETGTGGTPAAIRAATSAPGSHAVVFKSARPSDTTRLFCVDASSTSTLHDPQCFTAPGPTATPGDTYFPVWQRYIWYFVADYVVAGVPAGRELHRYVCNLSSPADALPDPGVNPSGTPPAGCADAAVARFSNPSSPGNALRFDVVLGSSTLSVTLQGNGEELVQGSPVPTQSVTLQSVVQLKNVNQ